ncbi:MAG: stage III sporulation protein AA [Bacillota bacterium]
MPGEGRGGKPVHKVIVDEILPYLPLKLRSAIALMPGEVLSRTGEIRLRRGRPVMLLAGDDEIVVAARGGAARQGDDPYIISDQEALATLQLMAGGSLYAFEEEIRQGYITLRGGHRVGLVGRAVIERGQVKVLKDISGFCVRVAREVLGAADSVMPHIIKSRTRLFHTLIISPPRCGKTTLLRDITRQASDGVPSLGFPGIQVGVVDERSEIAACYAGVPQNTVGLRTDVLDACPKAEGMIMLVRSMSPDLVVTDEIGREEDVLAICEVMNAGVSMIATAHGESLEDVAERPTLKSVFEGRLFERAILLSHANGPGTVEGILDARTRKVLVAGPHGDNARACAP